LTESAPSCEEYSFVSAATPFGLADGFARKTAGMTSIHPHFIRAATLAVLLAGSAAPTHGARGIVAGSCGPGAWSEPRRVAGVPAGSIVREPSLVAGGGRMFVAGQDFTVRDGGALPANPLLAVESGRGGLGRPAGEYGYYSPRALLDARGVLHLLWAEPEPGAPLRRTATEPRLTRLIHASYDGSAWAAPEEIYRSPGEILWSADLGGAAIDSAGVLHASFGDTREGLPTLVHLRGSVSRWETRSPERRHVAAYASLAAGRGDTLFLAYIGGDAGSDRELASVFVVRSTDGGGSWEEPVLVSRTAGRRATSVRVLAGPGGVVHLVWGQNLSGGLAAEAIRHAASRDGGATWSTAADLPVPAWFRSDLRAAVDRCGAVHVIYMDVTAAASFAERGSERGELRHARWTEDGWTPAESPFPRLNVIDADMSAAADGALHLFLMARPASDHTLVVNFAPMESTLVRD